jgi:cytochrome c peroxidase
LSEDEIDLGRRLFYDPILSLDSSISCGSCHSQVHAFADHNVPFSMGVGGAIGKRNAPALFNLAWHNNFMHDGGINHIELVPLAPITDELEMNLPIQDLILRLNRNKKYQAMFANVYGAGTITTSQLFKAITSFQLTLVSSSAKYDKVLLGADSYTPIEKRGHDIFMNSCGSCHQPPLFSDFSFANNGLDSVFKDAGKGRITQLSEDVGRFKVPSLRNISFTYPYMHDGRYYTLREVIDHYLAVGKSSKVFDKRIDVDLTLNESEIQALLKFLETLNDYEFIKDKRHSEPKN